MLDGSQEHRLWQRLQAVLAAYSWNESLLLRCGERRASSMLAREEPNRCLVRGIEWGIMMALLSHGVHDLDIFHSLLLKKTSTPP